MRARDRIMICAGLALGLVACGNDVDSTRGHDSLSAGAGGAAGQLGTAGVMPIAAGAAGMAVPQAGVTAGVMPIAGAAGMAVPQAGIDAAGAAGTAVPQAGMGTAGVQAMAGSGGAAGMDTAGAGAGAPPSLDECPPPPDGVSDKAIEAWTIVNEYRLAAGAGCMNLIKELVDSSQAHCDYLAMHSGTSCDAGAHGEMSGCAGFTGADVQSREIAAGYPRAMAYTEVQNQYGDNPTLAVPSWIDTVWHRIPLLDPWVTDMGWGGATGCDVIDIGRGMSTAPSDTIVMFPYDGQVDVPPAFSGLEGPAPPPPPGGWPSAYPINLYAKGIEVTEHVVMKDGDDTPLEHLWLDYDAPEVGQLRSYFTNTVFLYGAPFDLSTKYRVRIAGTYSGGSFTKEWTFTTGAKRPWGT